MRHKVAGRKLGRPTAHRMLMLRNLVTDLLRYEHVVTTTTKAQEVRPLAEKVITMGKEGSLHARRRAVAFLTDPEVAAKVFDLLAKRFSERPGGYTRITKLGQRLGDAVQQAKIELVE